MTSPDSTQDETRLREMLRAAVPEAPAVTPPARPIRRRGPVVAVLAVAAAVAAIAVVPLALGGDDDRTLVTLPSPSDGRTPLPTDPYAADPCPDRLPKEGDAEQRVPDLSTAGSVRLCGVDEPSSNATGAEFLGPEDALVSGLAELADAVADLPDADSAACAAVDYYDPYRTSVVVTSPQGTTALTASACATVEVGGRAVAAGDVASLVIEALGRQRATAEYPDYYYSFIGGDMSAWCDAPTTLAPVLPSDSDLAGAVLCPDYNVARATPTPLDDAALQRLRAAWRDADAPVTDDDFDGFDDEMASVVALTSYGDLVQMVPKEGVDGLLLVVPRTTLFFGPTAVVPITLDDLTD